MKEHLGKSLLKHVCCPEGEKKKKDMYCCWPYRIMEMYSSSQWNILMTDVIFVMFTGLSRLSLWFWWCKMALGKLQYRVQFLWAEAHIVRIFFNYIIETERKREGSRGGRRERQRQRETWSFTSLFVKFPCRCGPGTRSQVLVHNVCSQLLSPSPRNILPPWENI